VKDPAEDTNGDGVVDVLDCRADGGTNGLPFDDLVNVYIDQFYTTGFTSYAELNNSRATLQPLYTEDVVLGRGQGEVQSAAWRVGVPERYTPGNPLVMRLYLWRTGPIDGCEALALIGFRASHGTTLDGYAPGDNLRYIKLDIDGIPAPDPAGMLLVIDLPLNNPGDLANGLGLPSPNPADLLAFELGLVTEAAYNDQASYAMLGVDYFEMLPGTANLANAEVSRTLDFADCCELVCAEECVDVWFVVDYSAWGPGLGDGLCDFFDDFAAGVVSGSPAFNTYNLISLQVPAYQGNPNPDVLNPRLTDPVAFPGTCDEATILGIHSDLNGLQSGIFGDATVGGNPDPDNCPGALLGPDFTDPSIPYDQNWGPAVAVVAAEFTEWNPGCSRVIIPIVNNPPCLGGDSCDTSDADALAYALTQAAAANVIVLPLLVGEADPCIETLLTANNVAYVKTTDTDPGLIMADLVLENSCTASCGTSK
jgi:hypothetical protein